MTDLVEHISRQLARRAVAFAPTSWNTLIPLFERFPEAIFFGGGAPALELMPVERLRQAAALAWQDAPEALSYGEVAGFLPLRELIATRMAAQGMTVGASDLVVTNGSQQGIDLVCRLLIDPGDSILVENPTFLGALQVFDSYEATVIPVPMDDAGLQIDALARTLAAAPRPPKLLYTIPTFQNPTGVSLSQERREALIALARAHNLLLVEDDPYGELRYDGEPLPALRALDSEVVYLGTFSKTIAPGLRVGWIASPPALLAPFLSAKEAVDIHNERITCRTVAYAADGFLDEHLVTARTAYRRRRDTLLTALRHFMPDGVRWNEPEGGFFLWVELPDGMDAERLLPVAAARGAIYLPGAWFYPSAPNRRSLRLAFSSLPEDQLAAGIERLAAAIAVGDVAAAR